MSKPKTIAASRNPDLLRHVDRDLLRRSDLRLVTAATSRELVERARAGAALLFVDRVLPDGDAAALCAAIRGEKRLEGTRVVLVTDASRPVSGDEARAQGFDDVVELPAEPGVLSVVCGRLLGVALRDGERFGVRVQVYGAHDATAAAGPEYLGTTVDLSEAGLLVRSKRALPVGAPLRLRFALPGGRGTVECGGRVVRVDEQSLAPAVGLALAFVDLTLAARHQLRSFLTELVLGWPLRWHVVREANRVVVELSGAITPDSDLEPLAELTGPVELRLRDLRRLPPDGVRRFAEVAPNASALRLAECSVAFVQQANQIPSLVTGAEVVSFYAPYSCPRCGSEEERLVDAAGLDRAHRVAPTFACDGCGGPMLFDELPEAYFAFLDGTA